MGARTFLIRATAALLGLLLGGVVGELAIRTYAGVHAAARQRLAEADPMGVLVAPHGELGYRPRPGSVFRYGNGAVATMNSEGYRGPVVAVPKPADMFRVVLLGESTTHGWGVGDGETIDAFMRERLATRYAGRKFDVVNLAFDGYDVRQLLERFRTDGMRLQPDAIIVNTGVNDVRNARFAHLTDPDPRTLIWETVLRRLRDEDARGGPTLWTRMKHYSYLARLPAVAQQQRMHAAVTASRVTPDPAALEIFARNLERIAALARSADIPVIFSTPPSALAFAYPPDATSTISYWLNDAETTQRLRDDLAARMQRVVAGARRQGQRISYLAHELPGDAFLDDAHLTGAGNRQMAARFTAALEPYIDAGAGRAGSVTASTSGAGTAVGHGSGALRSEYVIFR
jgi:lysophospholipase L1-like esterase